MERWSGDGHQTALADELAANGWTVSPIICGHRADLPTFRYEVAGVWIVSGKDPVKSLRTADRVLSPADVERLATVGDARRRPGFVGRGVPTR
jgi:hypothetical protein